LEVRLEIGCEEVSIRIDLLEEMNYGLREFLEKLEPFFFLELLVLIMGISESKISNSLPTD
jgi:hypothetical protein